MGSLQLHATCISVGLRGILLAGEPGAGKSDLALRLIDRGAKLVADDIVILAQKGRSIIAAAPENMRGLIEVRGVGVLKLKHRPKVALSLVVCLVDSGQVDRLPYPQSYPCLGVRLPQLHLNAFEASAAIKVEMALTALQNGKMVVGAFKQ
jgi:HPr kinase/phosphorylase